MPGFKGIGIVGGRPRWNRWLHPWRNLLSVVLESPCPLCQRSTAQVLCRDCQRKLQQGPRSGQFVGAEGLPPMFAWGMYGGELKRAIAAFKYENQPQLAQPLGQWLGEAWLASPASQLPQVPVVVPIPLHATRLQERGFNQAELLAERFCRVARLPLVAQGLARSKSTVAQFQLTPSARERNMAQAFQVHPHLCQRDRPILLVDDIYTTGATVREAVQTCRGQGLRVCGVVVLAKA
jgi:ComF family protein